MYDATWHRELKRHIDFVKAKWEAHKHLKNVQLCKNKCLIKLRLKFS